AEVRTRLDLLSEQASSPAVQRVLRSAHQLEQLVRAEPEAAHRGGEAKAARAAVKSAGEMLALAFPDRLGQRRDGADARFRLANGRGAVLRSPGVLAREPFIVAVELDDREREALIDIAAPVSVAAIEALLADRITTEELFGWDEDSGTLVAKRVRR